MHAVRNVTESREKRPLLRACARASTVCTGSITWGRLAITWHPLLVVGGLCCSVGSQVIVSVSESPELSSRRLTGRELHLLVARRVLTDLGYVLALFSSRSTTLALCYVRSLPTHPCVALCCQSATIHTARLLVSLVPGMARFFRVSSRTKCFFYNSWSHAMFRLRRLERSHPCRRAEGLGRLKDKEATVDGVCLRTRRCSTVSFPVHVLTGLL